MAARRTSKEGLLRRVKQLEARVGRLEGTRPRPPAPARKAARASGPTCPGCSLALPRARRTGRCVWCGFRLDAVAPRLPRQVPRRARH